MIISLGSNQFLFSNNAPIPTSVGLVGHWCKASTIPEEGVVEVRSIPSFDGIDYAPGSLTTLFRGSKAEFLRWQEEFNGW
jgi:hypothetical protein